MKKEIAKLNRVAGQIKGLARMIEEEKNCDKIIIQFQATKGALNSIFSNYLNDNLTECMRENKPEQLKEIIKQISKK
jgi:CsoR family transcriptional regulator, copper-sensing transcriptional repressor